MSVAEIMKAEYRDAWFYLKHHCVQDYKVEFEVWCRGEKG